MSRQDIFIYSRCLMAALYTLAGIMHFVKPKTYLPHHAALYAASGIFNLLKRII